MLQNKDKIFNNIFGFQSNKLSYALKRGDWDKTKKILSLDHDVIIEKIKNSGLRGRGGAGFSTGLKWSFMPKTLGLSLIHI